MAEKMIPTPAKQALEALSDLDSQRGCTINGYGHEIETIRTALQQMEQCSETETLLRGFVAWFDCKRKSAPVDEARKYLEKLNARGK